MRYTAIRQVFRGAADSKLAVRGQDRHPNRINFNVLSRRQPIQHSSNFGGPPKTVPSGRREKNKQPNLAFIRIELRAKSLHIVRIFPAAEELIRRKPGNGYQQHSGDDPFDLFTCHRINSTATCSASLWRAFGGTVRTEHAAVARLRFEQLFAICTFIEKDARVRRHLFRFLKAAFWARDL